MPEALSEFHFLRPIWLVGLLALPFLIWLLHRLVARASAWRDVLDNDLAEPLLVSRGQRSRLRPLPLLAAVWLLTVIALAGPTWEKAPQPIVVREDALVVILDLTWSMYATDTAPNRLTAAKRKLEDLLGRRTEGMTGLITFAGDAHAVTPLTDDTETIKTLLPALKPDIMPAPGSRLAPALTLARQLFEQANVSSGRVLVMTDEIRDASEALAAAQSLGGAFSLSLLVIGTSEGAPISIQTNGQSSFLKDDAGNLVLPGVDIESLSAFASDSNALISALTLGPEDLDRLIPADLELDDVFRSLDREFDLWREFGAYLLLLIVPLAAMGFRRGWLWSLVPLLLFQTPPASASWWDDLWQTKDQQGAAAFNAGEPKRAAELFQDNEWKGTAHYRAGDFAAAAEQYSEGATLDDRYNLGNALAQMGETEAAIEAYSQVLSEDPSFEDAAFNKALLEQMQQNEQQQDQQNEEGDGDPSDQQQDSGDQSETEGEQSAPEDASQSDAEDESEQSDNAEEENPSDPTDQAEPEGEPESESEAAEAETAEEALDPEQQQAMEQWLKRVPDDPGGLLRRKFQQQFEDRVRRGDITRKDFERNW